MDGGNLRQFGRFHFQYEGLRSLSPVAAFGKRILWWWLGCASCAALLSLQVFTGFEILGVAVKCAKASWLLEVSFHGILS